jgi:transposase
LCSEKGYTNENLAVAFKVSRATIQSWMHRHPEFAVAVRDGKDQFDTREVQQILLTRCRGSEYEEETYESGNGEEMVLVKTITKKVQPDVTAIIFWLKNRDPDRWSDKQEITHDFTLADFMKEATLASRS